MLFTKDFQLLLYLAYGSKTICVDYKLDKFLEQIDYKLLKI